MQGVRGARVVFALLQLLPAWAAAAGGPCSQQETTIEVRKASDFESRLKYPATQTISLVLHNNLLLDSSIVLTSNFSCTKLTSVAGKSFTISSLSHAFPPLQLRAASNVLIHNVSFQLPLTATSPFCPTTLLPDIKNRFCPAIYIAKCWGVQIVQAPLVFGRIDIYRSTWVSIDHVAVQSVPADVAVVQIAYVGRGPSLQAGNVSITNCNITGGNVGVLIYLQSCGVTVSNNYFLNQFFAGVQCGLGVHNAGDCMLCTFSNNNITVDPTTFVPNNDSAAIYFSTHWVSVGNILSCNYAVYGTHCLYLDYCSSGVTVNGMVCYKTVDGLKINTGHANNISSFLLVQEMLSGWISCQNYAINNCLHDPGTSWEAQRVAGYDSPAFHSAYPWLTDFCKRTEVDGVSCNPAGSPGVSETGGCSGLPTRNKVEMVVVDPVRSGGVPNFLCPWINISSYNSISYNSPPFNHTDVLFNDLPSLDLGVDAASPIYRLHPDFISCPASENGIQQVSASVYADRFNVPPPPLAATL